MPILPPAPGNAVLDLQKYFRRFVRMALLRKLSQLLVAALGILNVTLLLAYVTDDEVVRISLLAGAGILTLGFAWLLHRSLLRECGVPILCRTLARRSPEFSDLYSAWELSTAEPDAGVSEELKRSLFRDVQQKLDREDPERWVLPGNAQQNLQSALLLALITASLFAAPPFIGQASVKKLYYGGGHELSLHVNVEPKGGHVLAGKDAEITAELLQEEYPYPKLFVEARGAWQEVPALEQGKVTRFTLRAVLEKVRYKVRWKNLESRPYTLTPIEMPYLTDFKVEIIHPSYTQLPAETLEGEPQLNVLRGTKLVIRAHATKDLERIEMVTAAGVRTPVKAEKGRAVQAELTVLNPVEFYFDLTDQEGISQDQPVRYHVSIREDRYPEIRLLAPATDLEAGLETKIPLTYEFKDDMGCSRILLNVRRGEGPVQKIPLKHHQPPLPEKIDDAVFDLSSIKILPGEVLKLQLEVQDNDTVTGPKSGFSQTLLVEIQSYEKKHAELEQELKEFRKDLLNALADQTLARTPDETWKSLASNPQELAQKMNEAAARQAQSAQKTGEVSSKLSKALEKMEQDPLTDYEVLAEHQAMKDALENIRNGAMASAQQNFSSKNWESAVQDQDDAIAQMERVSDLSEQVMKHNKMKDLVHSAERLEQKGGKLEDALSKGGEFSQELARELRDTLREAMDILAEIQKQVKDLPEELPEDFMNQAAMKDLDVNRMAQSAQDLNRALERGDMKAALEAARDLLKRVKAAKENISKASDSTPLSGKGDLSEDIKKNQTELDQIIERQENLLRKTHELDQKRQEAGFQNQKKKLAELAQRQKWVLGQARALKGEIETRPTEPGLKSAGLTSLVQSEPKMEKVLQEFESSNVLFSQKWLEEILQHLAGFDGPAQGYLNNAAAVGNASPAAGEWKTVYEKFSAVRAEEQKIFETLKDTSTLRSTLPSPQDAEQMKSMAEEQKAIGEKTKSLRNELAGLSSRSAQVKPEVLDSLKGARAEMKSSQGALQGGEPSDAASSEEKALSHLRKGQESLAEAQSQLSQMKQQRGSKPNMIQPRGGAPAEADGRMGSKEGRVHIPGAEDYLPPREFREEILESLKERYPKSQEEAIKQYYKKLTE